MAFFTWLEESAFSMWVKDPDTLFGYDLFLTSHAIGMALLVGFSTAIALRVVGFAPGLPLKPMERFYPVLFLGFWINALSGFVLFVIYPTKPIANPVFYTKMAFIVAAIVCIRKLRSAVFSSAGPLDEPVVTPKARALAGALLFIWLGAITAGRLMAYRGIANVEREVTIAMTILVAVLVGAGYAVHRLFGGADKQAYRAAAAQAAGRR
jgi:hypothetical protein